MKNKIMIFVLTMMGIFMSPLSYAQDSSIKDFIYSDHGQELLREMVSTCAKLPSVAQPKCVVADKLIGTQDKFYKYSLYGIDIYYAYKSCRGLLRNDRIVRYFIRQYGDANIYICTAHQYAVVNS